MNGCVISARAQEALKSFRRENEVGVIKIKMSASEFAAHQAAYLAAASGPFKTETICLAHHAVQCGDRNADTKLETRSRASERYGNSALENETDETVPSTIKNRTQGTLS